MAFGNDLIFDKILKYLIFDKDVKASKQMVQTVRLVKKNWLIKTSALLKRSKQPIVKVKMDGKKRLNQFVAVLTSPERLADSLLPFKLILIGNYFLEENRQSLQNCLGRLGNELMELEVRFPSSENTMLLPLAFPQMALPLLQKLSFEFPSDGFRSWGYENGLLLLKQVLNSSTNLRHFVFLRAVFLDLAKIPEHFSQLTLPDSILCVEIQDRIKSEYLEILLKNQLPKLKHLILRRPRTQLENDLTFKMLERFQRSLISFQIEEDNYCPSDTTILKFPNLERVKKLQIDGGLEIENSSQLQSLLPQVNNLILHRQTEATLSTWIRDSHFKQVESLSLSAAVDQGVYGKDLFKSVNLELLTKVHAAFPNVSKLAIAVNIKDVAGLLYIFQNMSQLKSLRIDFREYINDCSWKYESVLMGLPMWLISVHAEGSEYFQSFIRTRGKKPNLINLSELTSFTLWVKIRNEKTTFLSDLLFSQTFLCMPKLRTITFSENVQPTEMMKEKWTSEGRQIEYIAVEDETRIFSGIRLGDYET